MDSVAESIYHIEDRIGMCDCLPDRWQHRDRVEHSSEVCEWCEEEVRNDRCGVEAICEESVEESDEREQE